MQNFFLARQPIFDQKMNVFAYELLFRDSESSFSANFEDGDKATTQLLADTFSEAESVSLLGDKLAFINLTRNLILNAQNMAIPKERVVLEILEDVVVDKTLIEAVSELKDAGYRIALDDFEYREELRPLVELADIIKLDVLSLTTPQIEAHIQRLHAFNTTLLAEKVETHEIFDHCKSLGCEYFQGFFLCKPKLIKGKRIPNNQVALLNLISKLHNTQITPKEIADTINRDAVLSFKILRIINSAAYSLPRNIESMEEAVIMLGIKDVRNWANLLMLSSVSDKPHALLTSTMTRAKMCELLAQELNLDNSDVCFTVGLFSTLDALLDQPLDQLLDQMPVADIIRLALLERAGIPGQLLDAVIAHERANWAEAQCDNLTPEQFNHAYMQSITWVTETCQVLA